MTEGGRRMNTKLPTLLTLALIILMGSGCGGVLKQTVPVSTNPVGAKVYANGQYLGETPTSISLERNRDHVVTLIKENYQQKDVVIRKVYQREKTLMRAVSDGVDASRFFKDPAMGWSRGLSSMSAQEHSGEAYVLSPSSVVVSLAPSGGGGLASGSVGVVDTTSAEASDGSSVAPADAAELAKLGAGLAATQIKPIEKKWTSSSSSSSTSVSSDGSTRTTRSSSSSTSVGVGVNPLGLINVLDTLFK
jgi:hypothetical protein